MRFILDVHLPIAFASAGRQRAIDVVHIAEWDEGILRQAPDVDILSVASQRNRILLTNDRSTVTTLLVDLWKADLTHAGVIFVDRERFPARDVGGFQRALLRVVREMSEWDWTDRVITLETADAEE